jgi:L-lactate dehydrogenase complex protein LldF
VNPETHSILSASFIADNARADWHNSAVSNFRLKRDVVVKSIPEWEELRANASAIKDHVLAHLDDYLVEFERQALAHGVKVHWASTAEEHNAIIAEILRSHSVKRLVKSKSMLTEECRLNEHLEKMGIEVIDTDLGERIIQLRKEIPSHIIAPAIHIKREEVSDLFNKTLDTERGNSDPTYLARAARRHLREKFLGAQAAITGVNFAVAETGGVVVITNEGNADLGCHIPDLQIHSMGIEKIIPRWKDLGVFTRLISPSAAGQKFSIYTSHFHRPRKNGEMHIVLVDNGRSEQLGREGFRNSLKCIRCSACMNTCPVYRRTGGHSYHTPIAGPIGSILMPGKDLAAFADLPFASSLCGSCSDVCPVKIDIHEQLYRWRQVITGTGNISSGKRRLFHRVAQAMAHPQRFRWLTGLSSGLLKLLPHWIIYSRLNAWGIGRQMPEPKKETFGAWYARNRKST